MKQRYETYSLTSDIERDEQIPRRQKRNTIPTETRNNNAMPRHKETVKCLKEPRNKCEMPTKRQETMRCLERMR